MSGGGGGGGGRCHRGRRGRRWHRLRSREIRSVRDGRRGGRRRRWWIAPSRLDTNTSHSTIHFFLCLGSRGRRSVGRTCGRGSKCTWVKMRRRVLGRGGRLQGSVRGRLRRPRPAFSAFAYAAAAQRMQHGMRRVRRQRIFQIARPTMAARAALVLPCPQGRLARSRGHHHASRFSPVVSLAPYALIRVV